MSEQVEVIKQKLAEQASKLDAVATSVAGIGQDVQALKDKIATLSNGATPEEVAELAALVDGIGTKTDAVKTAAADLDAATDPGNV